LIFMPMLCGIFFSPPVAIQVLLVIGALSYLRPRAARPRHFLALSLAATAIAYGITGLFAFLDQWELVRLRDRFPYESMEDRLPAPHPHVPATSLLEDTEKRLTLLEATMEES